MVHGALHGILSPAVREDVCHVQHPSVFWDGCDFRCEASYVCQSLDMLGQGPTVRDASMSMPPLSRKRWKLRARHALAGLRLRNALTNEEPAAPTPARHACLPPSSCGRFSSGTMAKCSVTVGAVAVMAHYTTQALRGRTYGFVTYVGLVTACIAGHGLFTDSMKAHVLEPVEKDMRPRLASSHTRACMPCIRCTCVCRDIRHQLNHQHQLAARTLFLQVLTASCRARQDAPTASASLPGMLSKTSCKTGSGKASSRHGPSCAA